MPTQSCSLFSLSAIQQLLCSFLARLAVAIVCNSTWPSVRASLSQRSPPYHGPPMSGSVPWLHRHATLVLSRQTPSRSMISLLKVLEDLLQTVYVAPTSSPFYHMASCSHQPASYLWWGMKLHAYNNILCFVQNLGKFLVDHVSLRTPQ